MTTDGNDKVWIKDAFGNKVLATKSPPPTSSATSLAGRKMMITDAFGNSISVSAKAVALGLYPGVELPEGVDNPYKARRAVADGGYDAAITRADAAGLTGESAPPSPDRILDTGTPEQISDWLERASIAEVKKALTSRSADSRSVIALHLAGVEREGRNRPSLLTHLDEVGGS